MKSASQPRIYVAGHQGIVGSAIVRTLKRQGQNNRVTCSHRELDLCDQSAVRTFLEAERADQLYLAADKVGAGDYLGPDGGRNGRNGPG